MIDIIRTQATRQQVGEMLQMLETYIKLAVDVRLGILAGGGAMHADCVDPVLRARVAQVVQTLLGGI